MLLGDRKIFGRTLLKPFRNPWHAHGHALVPDQREHCQQCTMQLWTLPPRPGSKALPSAMTAWMYMDLIIMARTRASVFNSVQFKVLFGSHRSIKIDLDSTDPSESKAENMIRLPSDSSNMLATTLCNGACWTTRQPSQPSDSTQSGRGLQAERTRFYQPSQTHNYLLAHSRLCNCDSNFAGHSISHCGML